jgi:hypothetical protein
MRKLAAELLGTALLVLFGAGAATLVFGFRIFGSSYAAGLVAVALAFGLIYAALVYVIGPISGAHVNPAVTLGAYLTRRINGFDLISYWAAQLVGPGAFSALGIPGRAAGRRLARGRPPSVARPPARGKPGPGTLIRGRGLSARPPVGAEVFVVACWGIARRWDGCR